MKNHEKNKKYPIIQLKKSREKQKMLLNHTSIPVRMQNHKIPLSLSLKKKSNKWHIYKKKRVYWPTTGAYTRGNIFQSKKWTINHLITECMLQKIQSTNVNN